MQSTSLLFLGLMVGVFYLLLIRPQQKRMKQHNALVSSLRLGDEVVTIGGLFGNVKRLDEGHVWIEANPGTVLKFSRQAISKKIEPEDDAEALPEAASADPADGESDKQD